MDRHQQAVRFGNAAYDAARQIGGDPAEAYHTAYVQIAGVNCNCWMCQKWGIAPEEVPVEKPINIEVWINHSTHKYADGYADGDPMERALAFEHRGSADLRPESLCDEIYAMLNVDNPAPINGTTLTEIRLYHRYYPSLSIGDVIKVDGRAFAIDRIGFRELNTAALEF